MFIGARRPGPDPRAHGPLARRKPDDYITVTGQLQTSPAAKLIVGQTIDDVDVPAGKR